MEYKIERQTLTGNQQAYLSNLETALVQFITKTIKDCKSLGVTPTWMVKQRGEHFYEVEHNACFSIQDSMFMQSRIDGFLKKKLDVDFSECSLLLNVKYRTLDAEETQPMAADKPAEASKNDELPTFLPQAPRYDFEQIILPEETRKRIFNDLNTIQHQELIYHQWGFAEVDSKPKSILNFFGPPGTGKTMCAHAIAKKLEKPLLALNYSEIESKYVGEAAKNLKVAFDTATELEAVMFFDEADSFLGKRIENVSHGSDQALNSLRSQMLILLEEFEGVVLFATNLVTNFDKAFESRILDHIKFELPNREARAEMISKMIPSKLPIDHVFTQEELLEASDLIEGFAGREIKGAMLTMLLDKAGEQGADAVFTFDDLKSALTKKKEQMDRLKEEEQNRRKEKITKRLQEKLEEDAAIEQQKKAQQRKLKKRKR